MAEFRVKDRKGNVLTLSSKEQADYWVGLGYVLEGEPGSAQKSTTKKAAPRKRAAKK